MKLTLEQRAKALEFDRENWRRWADREITTDEACANLDRYMAELQAQSDTAAEPKA
jgi:hypothetical protein